MSFSFYFFYWNFLKKNACRGCHKNCFRFSFCLDFCFCFFLSEPRKNVIIYALIVSVRTLYGTDVSKVTLRWYYYSNAIIILFYRDRHESNIYSSRGMLPFINTDSVGYHEPKAFNIFSSSQTVRSNRFDTVMKHRRGEFVY